MFHSIKPQLCETIPNATTNLYENSAEDVADSGLNDICKGTAHILENGVKEKQSLHLVITVHLLQL